MAESGVSRAQGAAAMTELAQQMRAAASALLDALSPQQRRSAASGDLDRDELLSWTYLPGERPGLEIAALDDGQRQRASALLQTAYGDRSQALRVLQVEAIGSRLPVPQDLALLTDHPRAPYWLRILGEPGSGAPWSWRVSGHHLLAQATVIGDVVSGTPQFFGAQPARVSSGPHAGVRALSQEEDLARRLVRLLGDEQRELGVLSAQAPADIRSRHDPVAHPDPNPRGLPAGRMDPEQRELCEALLRQYVDRVAAPVANRAWADLQDAGADHITFGWAGGLEVGDGHYYALTGPTLLMEYDNTQDDANHIHSVWRDLRHDWGGDLLAQHYGHRHG